MGKAFTDMINKTLDMIKERSVTYSSKIVADIGNNPDLQRVDMWSVADGAVGLFRYGPDSNAYEIEVRPITQGRHKNLWGNLIKKKEDR